MKRKLDITTLKKYKHPFGRLVKGLLVFLFVFSVTFVPMHPVVFARTAAEIEEEKKQQEAKLKETQDLINKLNGEISSYSQSIDIANASIPQLQEQIKKVEAQLEVNKLELEKAEQNKKIKELEKAQAELAQMESVKSSYFDWRATSTDIVNFFDNEFDVKRASFYNTAVVSSQQSDILGISITIQQISSDIERYQNQQSTLAQQNESLQNQKRDLEARIAYLNYVIASNNSQISNLQSNVKSIQSTISFLTQEQKVAEDRERQLMQNNAGSGGGSGTYVDTSDGTGSFSFFGRGRDLYQGHGVGLSQWGAHGMALNGFNYQQIIGFYYANTQISSGYENATINVQGYGAMNIEDYVAGQSEVSGRACGTQEQAAARPDKYVVDNPNSMWDCWPEETIKAFAIVYRTYALNYVYRMGSICTTAACQVYNGTQYTRWAADETAGQVLTFGGNVIEAVYSSDNNQGFGTANNETRFQWYDGSGNPQPYLRSVNDNAYASRTAFTDWTYRTNVYTIADINNMLNFVVGNPGLFGGFSGYASGVLNTLGGGAVRISFERDPSNRVYKVWLRGVNGNLAVMGGYWFKYMWIEWVYNNNVRKQDGTLDYLYSQTFFIQGV